MIISIISTLVFAFFIITDLIPLYQNKHWKPFWVYTVLLSLSYTLHLLIVLKIEILSPAVPIKNMVSKIMGIP